MSDPLTFVYILVFTCQFLGGKKKKKLTLTEIDIST